jgi:hypothetical protein
MVIVSNLFARVIIYLPQASAGLGGLGCGIALVFSQAFAEARHYIVLVGLEKFNYFWVMD